MRNMSVRIGAWTRAAVCAAALGTVAGLAGAQEVERREVGNLVIENIPEVPAELRERLRQYQNVRTASFEDWAADGESLFISTRFGNTAQIHRVDEPLGARTQLTFFDEPVTTADYAPKGGPKGFLFRKDQGGDEMFQLYFFNEETGETIQFSDPETRVVSFDWSEDGSQIAWAISRADSPEWGIAIADSDDPSSRRIVFEEAGAWFPADWSPNGRTLLISNYVSRNESYLYLLDTDSGERMQINPTSEKISYGGGQFSVDGKSIYYTSDEGSQFRRLVRYDIGTGKKTVLTEDIDWDVEGVTLSPDGKLIAFVVNEAGQSKLFIRDAKSGEDQIESQLPAGLVSGLSFDPSGDRLAFTFESASSPDDVYVYDLKRDELTRWTRSEVGGLDTEQFVDPTLVSFPTFDEVDGKPREITAFYYKPKGEGPFPVLVSIHGGPESQFRPNFRATYQHWANELGVAILAPNVRGSSGYGKDFLLLDNGFKREDSVKDIGALLDWIETQDALDKDRVLVYGGSYGGYMVLASMVHYNDRLAGGINIVGISNFVTFLTNTKGYRRDLRRAEYGDERDPKMREHLEKISPLNNVDKITKPLFVIQGLNDPRVPASEAEQVVKAVRDNGGEVWYLLAKDEGHGFRKKPNRDYMTETIALFLEDVLLTSEN